MRLTARGRIYALAAAVLGGVSLLVGLRDFLYLVVFVAALVCVGVVYVLLQPVMARYAVTTASFVLTPIVGETVDCVATVWHRGRLSPSVQVVWEVSGVEHRVAADAGALPATSSYRWEAGPRGKRRLGVRALAVGDPLGVAVRDVTCSAVSELLVLPRYLENLWDLWEERAGDPGINDRPSARSALVSTGLPAGSVREFRMGDALRQIHWKQSARQGELLVNQPFQDEQAARSLLLVTGRENYASEEEAELAVSAAATVAAAWLRRGLLVWLSCQGESVQVMDESDLLRRLALVAMEEGPTRDADLAPDAVVTGHLSAELAEYLAACSHGGAVLARSFDGVILPERWVSLAIHPDDEATDG